MLFGFLVSFLRNFSFRTSPFFFLTAGAFRTLSLKAVENTTSLPLLIINLDTCILKRLT